MKASDTVLKPNELIRLADCVDTDTDIEASLYKQAEVTLKAVIKEVVEWIRDNCYEDTGLDDDTTLLSFTKRQWQSKLKEWGVE